jgi:outer membrane lipoprotein SlyB
MSSWESGAGEGRCCFGDDDQSQTINHTGHTNMRNKKMALALVLVMGASAAMPGKALAVGCLSGAVVGGVAGHVAGHHAVLGAVGGCVAGHELKKHQQKQAELARQQQMQNNGQNGGGQPMDNGQVQH